MSTWLGWLSLVVARNIDVAAVSRECLGLFQKEAQLIMSSGDRLADAMQQAELWHDNKDKAPSQLSCAGASSLYRHRRELTAYVQTNRIVL
jgi:hypothetical protein